MDALHFELIPLASQSFKLGSKAKDPYIRQYVERVLDVLYLHERKAVIVLNGAVTKILKADTSAYTLDALDRPDSPFSVNKTDGSQCRRKCRRERYKLSRADGRTLFIVAAPTFASQSMNGVQLANYGEKIFTTQEQQTRQAIRAMLSE